nr:dUTP diphosphatase [uncultured Bacillus sp.]
MNVRQLVEMQKVLDERIVKEHGLEGKDLEENKILALLVEICELANETRCFKHWSTKGPSEQSVLLEEYVDSLHFFLSMAIGYQYEVDRLYEAYLKDFREKQKDLNLVSAFNDIMDKILSMAKKKDPYHFISAFAAYLNLGKLLGFEWEEIENAYIQKNKINHQRQDKGY